MLSRLSNQAEDYLMGGSKLAGVRVVTKQFSYPTVQRSKFTKTRGFITIENISEWIGKLNLILVEHWNLIHV